LINEYLENGNLLKPKQIESLLINDFYKIASLFENEPLRAKKLLKELPSIGRERIDLSLNFYPIQS